MLGDFGIHQRLGEARLVAFVVAEAAVAPHVDHDVAIIFLAIFDRQLAAEGHRFGIVAVDVQDRRLDALGDIRRVRRRPAELGRGGEADLVVDDEMDRAAGAVAGQAGEAQTFPHHALSREGRVAVEQDRKHGIAFAVALDGLDGAAFAEHDRVGGFEMRRVGDQAQMDLDAVELAVGRGAEVVLHVARPADIGRIGGTTGEFAEDRAVRLAHDVGEDVQPAAVSHADGDLLHPRGAAIFDDRFQRGDGAFAAVEPEALGADVLFGEEFLPLLAVDDLLQDRLLAFGREGDRLVLALHPLLQEAAFLKVVDVHIFQADMAAIIGLAARRRSGARSRSGTRARHRARSGGRGRRR